MNLMTLKSNAFRFRNGHYRQLTGTAMGTPMATNYANLFIENFKKRFKKIWQILFKKQDLWYSFVLLTIFSSFVPVIRSR